MLCLPANCVNTFRRAAKKIKHFASQIPALVSSYVLPAYNRLDFHKHVKAEKKVASWKLLDIGIVAFRRAMICEFYCAQSLQKTL